VVRIILPWYHFLLTRPSSRAASQQRVVDTSFYFLNGYLSQGNFLANTTSNRGMIITLPDSVNFTFANSLTPGNGCPLFETGDRSALANTFRASYQSAVAERLNTMLDGLVLNSTDIGPMMDLCGFQTVINGNDEFCHVFNRKLQ
jgi:acid phosphatase